MKKYFLHTLMLCFVMRMVAAQTIPSSSPASVCSNCVPASWNIVSGQPSGSNITVFATTGEVWNLPNPPSGNSRFITERHNASGHHDVVSTTITGLVIGKNYRLSYNVITSDPSDPTKTGGYSIAKSASVSINNNGTIITQTTSYSGSQDSKVDKWTHNEITFLAKGTTALLTFTGTADYIFNPAVDLLSCPWPAGIICPPKYGVVGLDIENIEAVCGASNDQIVLLQNSLNAICPGTTVNLNSTLPGPPPNGLSYVWYTSQNHSGNPVPDPTNVAQSGSYYAFLFDAVNGCYNTNVSQAKVVVTTKPTTQVQLSTTSLKNVCPSITANLNTATTDAPPHNSELVWYTNPNHTGSPVPNPASVGTGTYYAFFHNLADNCFNAPTSMSAVNVQLTLCVCNAGTDQVKVSSGTATNNCSATTVDLAALNLSNIPSGTSLVWFTNPTHTGNPVTDPGAVTAGIYYAFIYDAAMNCYNTASSNAQVKVTINPCVTNVPLNIKAALQGSMSAAGSKMRNDLQTYNGTGLLPTSSPYSAAPTSYPSINNVAGVVGEVVDWVLVEIRSGTNPQTVLQSATLLLKPDGTIVSHNGQTPTFNPQSGPVRLVIKHRNHLAIMSNPIQSFTAGLVLNYDFTTALSQASNEFDSPTQMTQKNGIWCLRGGDLNLSQDFIVDGVDGSFFNVQFKSDVYSAYDRADISMDGVVDGVDGSLFNTSFYQDIYSTIINF